MENAISNISLEELSKIENLSEDTQKSCQINGLTSLFSILELYSKDASFENIKIFGLRPHLQLLNIFHKYIDSLNTDQNYSIRTNFENTESIKIEIQSINRLPNNDTNQTISNEIPNSKFATTENYIYNISLDELSKVEKLSVRTQNICRNNDILDLNTLKEFYYENGTFLNIKNCGRRSHLELFRVYEKYKDFQLTKIENIDETENIKINNTLIKNSNLGKLESNYQNIGLDELIKVEKLSIRTQNICKYNGLLDINSIIEYFNENGTFLKARNCGNMTHFELLRVYEKYKDFKPTIKNEPIEISNSLQHTIETLTARQKFIINHFIESKLKILSINGANSLKVRLKGDYSINGMKSILFMKKYEFKQNKFVGSTTLNEIISFVEEVNWYIELVSNLKNENEISFEVFKIYLSKKFSIEVSKLDVIATDYDFSNGLPIFKIVNVLLDNCCIFEERDTEIFKLSFNYFNGKTPLTIDELAEKLKLTRSRIRQLKSGIFEEIKTVFEFVRELEFSGINLYGLDINSEYIVIDEELVTEINKNERTNFNSMFITKILSIILGEKYSLIGDEYGILFDKTRRNSHNWIHTYLVSKNHSNKIDFIQFIENASSRLSEKIDESYSFHFQTYLLEFKNEDFRNEIDKIAQIAEYILFQECGLSVNIEDSIEFTRNTYKPVIEYVYEALEEINKPLTVYELYNIIEEKHPGITKSADALRGNLIRATNLIYFGRSSTYGLKIWEDEQTIKGGTIRDIVEEFLENQDTPIHIDKVTEYVNQFRNTNSKNIYSNLQMHEDKKFSFFKGLLIGLTRKEYNSQNFPQTKENPSDRRTFEESLECLKQFTEENDRLPSSNGNESEIKLYRFLNMQQYLTSNNPEKEKNRIEIMNIVSKFDYVKRKRLSTSKTEDTYNELLKFISQFRRLPMAKINDEKALYNFFYRQRKLYSEQNLPSEFVNKFMEVINILKSYYEN